MPEKLKSLIRRKSTLEKDLKKRKYSILIISKDELVEKSLKPLLTKNYGCLFVSELDENKEVMKGATPDIVVIDCSTLNGASFEPCIKYTSKLIEKNIIVYLLVDRKEMNKRTARLMEIADDLSIKPLNPEDLLAEIESIFHFREVEKKVESHYKKLNLIQIRIAGKDKTLESQREVMKDLCDLISDMKVKMRKKNRELWEAYARLQELRDLIDRRVPKQKEKYLERELIQADKMVAIGQLASGVAHDLNNPLIGVLGNAQLLLGEIPKHNQWYQDVERIYQSAVRCKDIVTNLVSFSRQEEFKFELVDINNEVIQNTLSLCEHELELENINVVKEFDKELPRIHVGVLQMEQLFLNLIMNARQAMRRGGTLTISTRLVKIEGVPGVEVAFVDTGKGIKKEDLSKMFKPFFTTKGKGKGTGLGLSISRGIVEKHNGTIKAESEGEGKGAKFTIFLPYRKEN